MEFVYPLTANPLDLLLVFLLALGISHAVLLPLLGLNDIRWHALDYLWLPMALIGILGAAQQNRGDLAQMFKAATDSQLRSALDEANRDIKYHTSNKTYLCRMSVRSTHSPPPHIFAQMERDGAATCDWFKELSIKVPRSIDELPENFSIKSLPVPPKLSGYSGSGPEDAISYVLHSLKEVENLQSEARRHQSEKDPPLFARAAKYYGPLLLCIALAIRITKVTGELRIKRQKSMSRERA